MDHLQTGQLDCQPLAKSLESNLLTDPPGFNIQPWWLIPPSHPGSLPFLAPTINEMADLNFKMSLQKPTLQTLCQYLKESMLNKNDTMTGFYIWLTTCLLCREFLNDYWCSVSSIYSIWRNVLFLLEPLMRKCRLFISKSEMNTWEETPFCPSLDISFPPNTVAKWEELLVLEVFFVESFY